MRASLLYFGTNHHVWARLTPLLACLVVLALALLPATQPQRAAAAAAGATGYAVGPVDPVNGYPAWYQDGTGLRLAECLIPGTCLSLLPNPAAPASFPDNFPQESFYWGAKATLSTAKGGKVLMFDRTEGAFFPGCPKGATCTVASLNGTQITFSRIVITGTGLQPKTSYTITHPYGIDTVTTDSLGAFSLKETSGCRLPCDPSLGLGGRTWPWLRWDPAVAPAPPPGFIGDAAVPHSVTGSPFGTNYLRVQGPGAGGPTGNDNLTDQFNVNGQIAGPGAAAGPRGGVFVGAQTVTLSSFPGPLTVYYTTDGTNPVPGASLVYSGPLGIPQHTTLKFLAVDAAGNQSPVYTENYTIDAVVPTVTASPPGGIFNAPPSITLTAADPAGLATSIFYTTDGSDPTSSPTRVLYTGATLTFNATTSLRYVAIDSANNRSVVGAEKYTLATQVGPIDAVNGYPIWYQDSAGLRLGPCLVPGRCLSLLPNPAAPASFPDNFPQETFYWGAKADLTSASGGKILMFDRVEGAFFPGCPKGATCTVASLNGTQITFSRLFFSGNGLQPNANYVITHPYGVDTVTTDSLGAFKLTVQNGCITPCDFTLAVGGRMSQWLRWDPAVAPAPPAGFIGDAAVLHSVIGSPFGTNFFRVQGPGAGGPSGNDNSTDQFNVQGQIIQ
ncbi:MAG: hypothetical protein E6I52_27040 [Chloroflexi bacterium]|nr:MAG: hypothetical protein E6I52_27040 [Chloroflexota bacterium]